MGRGAPPGLDHALPLARATPTDDHFEMVAVAILGGLVFSSLNRSTYRPGRTVEDVRSALMVTISGLQPSRRRTGNSRHVLHEPAGKD